jgi:hypothetical protein
VTDVDGLVGHRPLLPKRLEDLGADLIATAADGRTEVKPHIRGARPEGTKHRLESPFEDPGRDAAPARMDGSDRPTSRIDQEDRNAVGGGHGQENTGLIGDMAVCSFEERGGVGR